MSICKSQYRIACLERIDTFLATSTIKLLFCEEPIFTVAQRKGREYLIKKI